MLPRPHAHRTFTTRAANNIQQKGMATLSKCLACKRHRGLQELDLSYNGFGDPGMEQLSEAIAVGACPALEKLRIACACMATRTHARRDHDHCEPRVCSVVAACVVCWCMLCASSRLHVCPACPMTAVGMSDAGFAALCEPLATRCMARLVVLDVRCTLTALGVHALPRLFGLMFVACVVGREPKAPRPSRKAHDGRGVLPRYPQPPSVQHAWPPHVSSHCQAADGRVRRVLRPHRVTLPCC